MYAPVYPVRRVCVCVQYSKSNKRGKTSTRNSLSDKKRDVCKLKISEGFISFRQSQLVQMSTELSFLLTHTHTSAFGRWLCWCLHIFAFAQPLMDCLVFISMQVIKWIRDGNGLGGVGTNGPCTSAMRTKKNELRADWSGHIFCADAGPWRVARFFSI